jgi:quercetin dioxygenase-like cupin family protein
MKVKGEVVWHHHDVTDDLVFVLNGRVTIRRHEVYVTC